MYSSKIIREKFINFFLSKGHKLYKPNSLISNEEDNTMFTIAGMKQFSNIFLGKESIKDNRIITIQPCLRMGGKHNDLNMIGKTSRHNTFFEMMGNFAFSDYFKKQAIEFAYEFLVQELKMDLSKMFFTVHSSDMESFEIWRNIVGNRVIINDSDDNFWKAGNTGPCGPCTEIFVSKKQINLEEAENIIKNGGNELLEIWNIVFIQFNETLESKIPLSNPNIDTGMGLERLCSVLNGTFDNFETDLLKPIVNIVKSNNDINKRICADYAKSITFLLNEFLIPSNTKQGYVLRKLIRSMYNLCFNIKEIIEFTIILMSDPYTDLLKNKNQILEILNNEIEIYKKEVLNNIDLSKYEKINEEQAANIYQTFGVPIQILLNKFPYLNIDKINEYQKKHQKISNNKIQIKYNVETKALYDIITENESKIVYLEYIEDKLLIVTESSCFYPRGGGQEGDIGSIIKGDIEIKVLDTIKQNISFNNYIIIHICEKVENINIGDKVKLLVNNEVRKGRTRAHSALHIFGEYLIKQGYKQNGSFVDYDYARIDLIGPKIEPDLYNKALEYTQKAIKKSINSEIYFEEFKNLKNIITLDNNYGNIVRVVNFPEYSTQLCGGTHVNNTSEIDKIIVKKESSIKNGIRRIEILTGSKAIIEENQQKPKDIIVNKIELELNGKFHFIYYSSFNTNSIKSIINKYDKLVILYYNHNTNLIIKNVNLNIPQEFKGGGTNIKFLGYPGIYNKNIIINQIKEII